MAAPDRASQESKHLFWCRVYLDWLAQHIPQEWADWWIQRKEVMRGVFCFLCVQPVLSVETRDAVVFDHLPAPKCVWVRCFVIQTGELVSLMHIYYRQSHCETQSPVGFISFELIWHKMKNGRIWCLLFLSPHTVTLIITQWQECVCVCVYVWQRWI